MELRGTIHSIKEWEQLFITKFPHKVIHDGYFKSDEFDSDKSASKVPAQSEVYAKLYQLFPPGKDKAWEERANVRICYDERHGTGTLKISDRGMHILGMQIEGMLVKVKVGKAEVPAAIKNTVHIKS